MSSIVYILTHRDPKNVLWKARITDTNNPYNVQFTAVDNGNGTMTVTFTFATLPADATGTSIGYSTDGVNWTSNTGGVTSPRSITIPTSIYFYQFVVQRPGGNEIFYLNMPAQEKVIKGTAESIRISAVNNDNDVHHSIRAKQAVIKFISTSQINLNSFAGGAFSDKRYYVEVSVNTDTNIVFKGFLEMSDLSEPFLSPSNVVTLTATDKLGSLKDVAMTDFSGNNPSGHYTIAKYIAFCLRKTGLSLKINVISNLREEHDQTQTWFNTVYMWARTFEDTIGTSLKCYTVLEQILKKHGVLWQRNGEWWIRWVDEWDQHPVYITQFNEYGEVISVLDATTYDKEIKRGNAIYFIGRSTNVTLQGQHKHAKLNYSYRYPQEMICNIDFSRGTYVSDISATAKKYALECWTLKSGAPPFSANNNEAYLVKEFNTVGYEVNRYVEITFPNYVGGNASFLESEGMNVDYLSKFSFGYEFRWSDNYTSGSGTINAITCSVRLDADDGTVYFLDEDGYWYLSDATWSTNYKLLILDWDRDAINETDWRPVSWPAEITPVPKAGKLHFMIHWENHEEFEGINLNVKNFTFEYYPYIDGTYRQLSGQYFKVSQAGDFNEVTEDEVYISDAPSRLMKGALLYKDGTVYKLAGRFFNAAVFPAGPPDESYLHPFNYIQGFAVFNQVKQITRLFRFTAQGLDAASLDDFDKCDMPELVHSYKLLDNSPHTLQKDFMLLSFDANTYAESWNGVLKEVYNRATGKIYTDSWEFKYISAN